MMFRTITVSTLAAMVQAAVIESKPQQHLQKGEGAGKILTEAGVAAAAAGALAAAANTMASAQSSKSSDDTTTTPAPVCNAREVLDKIFTDAGINTGTGFCEACEAPDQDECKADADAGFAVVTDADCTDEDFNEVVNPKGFSCEMWLRKAPMGCNDEQNAKGEYVNADRCVRYIANLLQNAPVKNGCKTSQFVQACKTCKKDNDVCMV